MRARFLRFTRLRLVPVGMTGGADGVGFAPGDGGSEQMVGVGAGSGRGWAGAWRDCGLIIGAGTVKEEV